MVDTAGLTWQQSSARVSNMHSVRIQLLALILNLR